MRAMGFRLALGRLVATPVFTIFSIVSLASGVAVTTAVYSVVDTLLLADAGVADPVRTVILTMPSGGRAQRGSISEPDFEDLRRAQTSFSTLGASAPIQPAVATTGVGEIVTAEAVDGGYFTTLGVGPALGRVITAADVESRSRIAVLSDEFWRSRFAADRSVIGREIRVNGQTFDVIGVASPRYRGAFGALLSTRVWIPLGTLPAGPHLLLQAASPHEVATQKPDTVVAASPREDRRLMVFGRLAEGRTLAQTSAELAAISSQLDASYPPVAVGMAPPISERRWSAKPFSEASDADNSLRRLAMMIVALVGLVLLIACTNLANLVLARGTARQGELAVRMAMGASRGRLIWEQCIESVLLAIAGGFASYVMFQALSAFMTTDFVMGLPFGGTATLSIRPAINAQAVTVAVIGLLLALGVFGLEPAVQLARTLDLRSALAVGATGIRPRVSRQRMVIRWQVAIAAGFFIVATLFIRATLSQARHDPGIDMDRLAVAVLNFDSGVWDENRIRRAVDRILEEARGNQAIESIAASTGLPFGVPALTVNVRADDAPAVIKPTPLTAVAATPSLLATLGVEIVRGRRFDDSDGPAAAPAVMLSEQAARQLFNGGDAIGRTLIVRRPQFSETRAVVVGIARDTDVRWINGDARGLVYLPLSQHFGNGLTITARSTGTGVRAVPALRDAIRRADPDLAVTAIGAAPSLLAGPMVLLGSLGRGALYLGALSLLLSMAGLFGVQSHVVAHRTREIGVRMSVGATARQIKLMVLQDGYRPVFEGLLLGLWGGIAGRIVLRSYLELEDVVIIDPWMLLLTPIPLIAAAFCACYLPASRAASVDPTVALRCE